MTLCLNALDVLYIRPPTNPLPQPHQPPQAASPITTPPSTGTPTPTRTLADANLPDQEVQDRCLRFPFLRGPLVLDKWPGYFKHAYRRCLVGAGGSFQLVPPAFFDWSCTSEFMRRKDPLAYTHTHTHTHTHTLKASAQRPWCSVPRRSRPLAGKSTDQTCSDKDIAFTYLPAATVGPDKTRADGEWGSLESPQALRPATAKKGVWATSSQ